MACGCGKKKAPKTTKSVETMRSSGADSTQIIEELTRSGEENEFIYAIYNGPSYPHHMRSVTGIINKLYGLNDYGIGRRGDIIKVHKLDYEKSYGKLYLPLGEEEMATKGIRGLEYIRKANFSTEAESNRLARKALDANKPESVAPTQEVKVEQPEEKVVTRSAPKKSSGQPTKSRSSKSKKRATNGNAVGSEIPKFEDAE